MQTLYSSKKRSRLFHILLTISLIFSTVIAHGQVSGVNRKASNNASHRGSSSSSSSGRSNSYSSSSCPSDDDDDWNFDGTSAGNELCLECCGYGITGLSNFKKENKRLIDFGKKNGMPWVQGLEIMLQSSYGPTKYKPVFIKPEFRLNLGKLSTQMRITLLKDETGEAASFDWQILVFNLVNDPYMNLRYGHGIMLEESSGLAHYETTGGLEFHFEDHKYNPIVEYRFAFDNQTKAIPRQEWNIRFDYKLLTKDKTHFHLSAGYIYQNYYQSYKFHMAQAGLNIGIY